MIKVDLVGPPRVYRLKIGPIGVKPASAAIRDFSDTVTASGMERRMFDASRIIPPSMPSSASLT